MPTGSSVADNFHLGGIASPINIETGRLGRAVEKCPQDSPFSHNFHPDTGDPINEEVLPYWQKVKELAYEVHSTVDIPIVGWDIAMTANGPTVVEGNERPGASIVEIPPRNSNH